MKYVNVQHDISKGEVVVLKALRCRDLDMRCSFEVSGSAADAVRGEMLGHMDFHGIKGAKKAAMRKRIDVLLQKQ